MTKLQKRLLKFSYTWRADLHVRLFQPTRGSSSAGQSASGVLSVWMLIGLLAHSHSLCRSNDWEMEFPAAKSVSIRQLSLCVDEMGCSRPVMHSSAVQSVLLIRLRITFVYSKGIQSPIQRIEIRYSSHFHDQKGS